MSRPRCFFVTVFFLAGSTVFSQPLSPDAEQRLLSFCELYSTVKYYYPDPNLQDLPWNAFAYQGYEIAKTSKNDKEFIKKMDKLFRIIAPGVQISNKEFNLARITPKDTSLYYERAFWQHQGGLNVEGAAFSNASTLNYIYKKPADNYKLIQTIVAKPKGLFGKKIRISLMAKVENNNDSIRVLSFFIQNLGKQRTENEKATTRVYLSELRKWKDSETEEYEQGVEIKVSGSEWKRYVMEINYPDNINFSRLTIYHPQKGTVYLDDLKLERLENDNWEEIDIPNSDFENYTSSGTLSGWETMYALGALSVADSMNAVEGKYCLKLPAVQDKLLYFPASINNPHIISLPIGYKAYIPLQLYADENSVFPSTDRQLISDFRKKEPLTVQQLAIACVMQIWAALYHDYPYREDDFEDKLNRLLFQTIHKLNTTKETNLIKIIAQSFLQWINDTHLNLEGGSLTNNTAHKKTINIPVKFPNATCLTENQWVVTHVMDNVKNLQTGDGIMQINDMNIDSLLQLYKVCNISRKIQHHELERLLTTSEPEMKVQLLRNGETIDVVFSTDTRQKGYSMMAKEKREHFQVLQDSLKETKELFYLNTIFPPNVFSRSIIGQSMERTLNQYSAADSLITEMNRYKALILDVRGRPDNAILDFFNECMGIDLNRNSDVIKTTFSPVAQFKYDTVNLTVLKKREERLIHVPVYVLIDYNTMSAPERNLLNLRKSGRATFIGSNTAGAAGPVCKTKIADNITLVYTSGQIVGLDDNPMSYQGTGIPPDIYVYPTPQGIAEGRDEVLEKAIEIALKNIKE